MKAEVERTASSTDVRHLSEQHDEYGAGDGEQGEGENGKAGQGSWVQMSIEIPGFRDDDALPVFLSEMMREPLVGSVADESGMTGGLKGRLVINKRWHWRLYIDVCFFSLGVGLSAC